MLQFYKFGVIFYPINSIASDLCSPLKIHDYLLADLIIISLFKNKSLVELKKKFPKLIYFYNESLSLDNLFLDKDYFLQKKNYFQIKKKEMMLFDQIMLNKF